MSWTVYRLFDVDGACLYVGMTSNLNSRLAAHRRKPWGSAIAEVRTQTFDDKDEASGIERTAIRFHRPAHNVQWNDLAASTLTPAEERLADALDRLDRSLSLCEIAPVSGGPCRFDDPRCAGCVLAKRKHELWGARIGVPELEAAA